jgi:hypothetical protein
MHPQRRSCRAAAGLNALMKPLNRGRFSVIILWPDFGNHALAL